MSSSLSRVNSHSSLDSINGTDEQSGSDFDRCKSKDSSVSGRASSLFEADLVGQVVQEFPCLCTFKDGQWKGTLFATQKALCFDSPSVIFGLGGTHVIIPWENITAIGEEGQESINIHFNEDQPYMFTPVDQNKVTILDTLAHLRNEHNLEKERREKDDGGEDLPKTSAPNVKFRNLKSVSSSASDIGSDASLSTNEATEEQYLAACAVTAISGLRSMSAVMASNKYKPQLVVKTEESEESRSSNINMQFVSSSLEVQQAWRHERDSKNLGETGISGLALSCDLEHFFHEFLVDQAPHSIPLFMGKDGDFELHTTPWKVVSDGTGELIRTISYSHPIKAPMAPPSAHATKTQTCQVYGDAGICLKTRTIVIDVPMTDCFHVQDRILVEPTPDGGVSVTADFKINFVKQTIFKHIIYSTTKGDFLSWFDGLAQMMQDALQRKLLSPRKKLIEEKHDYVDPAEEVVTWGDRIYGNNDNALQMLQIFCITLIVIQIVFFLELRSMKESIQNLEIIAKSCGK
eukprot:scaffold136201_cov54-Attheya_sp.AAC.3